MWVARVALGAVTLLLLASAGGGFVLLPLLVPLYIWAARRSGTAGRVGWSLAAGLGLGMTVWALVYVLAGEQQPAIWLVPLLSVGGGAWLVHRAA